MRVSILLYCPCTFAPWSAHAQHLVLRHSLIKQIARHYSHDIQFHGLPVVAMETAELPVDDASWGSIVEPAYCGSMAIFYNHSPREKVAVAKYNGDSMAFEIDRCLASQSLGRRRLIPRAYGSHARYRALDPDEDELLRPLALSGGRR